MHRKLLPLWCSHFYVHNVCCEWALFAYAIAKKRTTTIRVWVGLFGVDCKWMLRMRLQSIYCNNYSILIIKQSSWTKLCARTTATSKQPYKTQWSESSLIFFFFSRVLSSSLGCYTLKASAVFLSSRCQTLTLKVPNVYKKAEDWRYPTLKLEHLFCE